MPPLAIIIRSAPVRRSWPSQPPLHNPLPSPISNYPPHLTVNTHYSRLFDPPQQNIPSAHPRARRVFKPSHKHLTPVLYEQHSNPMKKSLAPTNEIPGKRLTTLDRSMSNSEMLERLGILDFKDPIFQSDRSGSYFHLQEVQILSGSIVGDPAKFRNYFLDWWAIGHLLGASFPARLHELIGGIHALAYIAKDDHPFDSFDFNHYAKLQWEAIMAGRYGGIKRTQEEFDECVKNSYFPLIVIK